MQAFCWGFVLITVSYIVLSEDSNFLEDESTKIFARKVADHYSAIIHLKKLNNWIKSVLIQLYAHRGDAVLDLACGKGGDLIKWDKAKIGYYVGIDIAEGSIEACRTRYNGDSDYHQRRKKFTFPACLICGDYYEVRLDKALADDAPFDICSCQLKAYSLEIVSTGYDLMKNFRKRMLLIALN